MTIQAAEVPDVTVAVAEPGPLITMKLQSIMNRGAAKEGTDLLDIIRLCLDPATGPAPSACNLPTPTRSYAKTPPSTHTGGSPTAW